MAQLSIVPELLSPEIHIAVFCHITVALGQDISHDVQYLMDMLGSAGANGGRLCVQAFAVADELSLEFLGHLFHGAPLLLGLFDQFVINIGNIGHINHLVPLVFQVAAQGVEHHHRPRVADMDIVVHGGPAHINAVFARGLGHKLFFFSGEGIKDLHRCTLLFCWGRLLGRPLWKSGPPFAAHKNASVCQLGRRRRQTAVPLRFFTHSPVTGRPAGSY